MVKVGVTGGIGSGKSAVCSIFKTMGFPVYDSDKRAKTIVNEDESLKNKIIGFFGNEAYDSLGLYNRSWMAEQVFADNNKLKVLNGLIHPAVKDDFEFWLKQNNQHAIVFKETALLIETGIYKAMDFNMNICSPKELRVQRILKRDSHRTLEMVVKIIDNQLNDEEKNKLVDGVIFNDEKESLIEQANQMVRLILKKFKS